MKVVVHISFYYRDKNLNEKWASSEEKLPYLKKIIEEYNNYPTDVDIFIHSNETFDKNIIGYKKYTNGSIRVIKHSLLKYSIYKGKNYYLTWASRKILKKQKNQYDVFIYQEDDIFIPIQAYEYWIENKDICLTNNFNLGFLRIEIKNNTEYISDISNNLRNKLEIENKEYAINDINPYCAFWIYDKKEFNKWVSSKYYNLKLIHGKDSVVSDKLEKLGLNYFPSLRYLVYSYKNSRPDSAMEASAIGLNGLRIGWYRKTLIPIKDNYLDKNCKVFHLSNYYANETLTDMGTIEFNKLLD